MGKRRRRFTQFSVFVKKCQQCTHTHTHNEKVHNCTTTCILSDQTKYYTTPGIHSYIYLYTNIPSHFYIINKRNVLLHAKKKKKKKNFFLQKKKKKKKKKKK